MCPKLKEITLAHNKITTVKNLTKLANLQLLDLGFNHIENSEELTSLQYNTKLKYLNLRGNPLATEENFFEQIITLLPGIQQLPEDVNIEEKSEFTSFGEFSWLNEEEKVKVSKMTSSKSTSNLPSGTPKGIMKNLNGSESKKKFTNVGIINLTPTSSQRGNMFNNSMNFNSGREERYEKLNKSRDGEEEPLRVNLTLKLDDM